MVNYGRDHRRFNFPAGRRSRLTPKEKREEPVHTGVLSLFGFGPLEKKMRRLCPLLFLIRNARRVSERMFFVINTGVK